MRNYAPREGRPNPLNFGGQVTFERRRAGRPEDLIILNSKLLSILRVFLEAPGEAKRCTCFNSGQAADDGDTTALPVICNLQQPDGITIRIVGKENLLKNTLDLLVVLLGLIHGRNGGTP